MNLQHLYLELKEVADKLEAEKHPLAFDVDVLCGQLSATIHPLHHFKGEDLEELTLEDYRKAPGAV